MTACAIFSEKLEMRITNGMTARAIECDLRIFGVRVGSYGLFPYPGKEKSLMIHACHAALTLMLDMARCALFGLRMKLCRLLVSKVRTCMTA